MPRVEEEAVLEAEEARLGAEGGHMHLGAERGLSRNDSTETLDAGLCGRECLMKLLFQTLDSLRKLLV